MPNIEELNCCEQRGRIKEMLTSRVLEIISNTFTKVFVKTKKAKKFIKMKNKKQQSEQLLSVY